MCHLPEAHVRHVFEDNKKLHQTILSLKERVIELERRLRLYESPHIPSSKHVIKEVRTPREPKQRGAPHGHTGATRNAPKIDRVVVLKPMHCPDCKSNRIQIIKEHAKTVEDIAVTRIATRFSSFDCRCQECGNEFTTADQGLPTEGRFGPTISSLWSMLHYKGMVPFDRLSQISENCFGVPITPAGLHNVIYRNASILQPHFDGIAKRVSKAKYVRSDETSYPCNGDNWWMWNISTLQDTLVLLRKSRGAQVLEEVFGEFLDGVLNSDCFSAYERFKAREYQKCWAHILRDAKDLAKNSAQGEKLYWMLARMYRYIRKAKRKRRENTAQVKRWVQRAKKEMAAWLEQHHDSKALLNLVLRITKYTDQWFTCLKYRVVEPTNNASEREIRKGVIARKISCQHRSKKGMHAREIMMSTMLTCDKQEVNPFALVRDSIEKHNLGLEIS